MSKYKIYISPSDQDANKYAVGNTTEMEQCHAIAPLLVDALNRCGFEAKTNLTDTDSDGMYKRIAESNDWGADIHIPIHTNAFNGSVSGTRIFYYDGNAVGKALAQCIMDTLSPITPGESDAVKTAGYAELKQTSATCVYVEVGFHDNPVEAQWIIDHHSEIAEAICEGVCKYFGVEYVAETPLNPDVPEDSGEAEPDKAVYKTVDDVPEYGKATIRKLIDKGLLKGTGSGLELSEDMVRMFVINDRAGLYD